MIVVYLDEVHQFLRSYAVVLKSNKDPVFLKASEYIDTMLDQWEELEQERNNERNNKIKG